MKKNNFKSLAAVLSLAMAATAVPVNANAAAAPKITVNTTSAYSGNSYKVTVKNLKKGYTVQLSSTEGGVTFTKKKIKATGAKVSTNFKVKAAKNIADGLATKIKAVVKNAKGKKVKTVSKKVTLKQLANTLTVKDLQATTVTIGDEVNADATISPAAAKGAYKKTFSTSDSSVLECTNASNGLFKAVGEGTATISVVAVNDEGRTVEGSKTLTVTVKAAEQPDDNKPGDDQNPGDNDNVQTPTDSAIQNEYVLQLEQGKKTIIANSIDQDTIKIKLTAPTETESTSNMTVTVNLQRGTQYGSLSQENITLVWNEAEKAWVNQVTFTSQTLTTAVKATVRATITTSLNAPASEQSQIEGTVSNEIAYDLVPATADEDNIVPVKATKAEVVSTDRLVLTFNQAVNAATFYNKDKALANGVNTETGTATPPKYFNLLVRDHVREQETNTVDAYYYTNRVQAILQGKDDKTLVFVFDNGFELADNTKFVVDFTDMRNGVTQSDRLSNYITDIDTPAVQKVETIDMKTIRVYFDQPVVAYSNAISTNNVKVTQRKGVTDAPAGYNQTVQYNGAALDPSALKIANFSIDGVNLSQNATYRDGSVERSYFGEGNAKIKLAEGYEDARNVIDITLGTYKIGNDNVNYQSYFKPGNHVVQVVTVGDYASLSETNNNNRITTQNFDFTVNADNSAPNIDIQAQSPEQYVITFNCQIEELAGTVEGQVLPDATVNKMGLWLAFKDPAKIADQTTKQTFGMAYETDTKNAFGYSWDTAGAGLGQQIKVTRLTNDDKGNHRIKVEVVNDWTQLQDYKDNNKTYTAYELYIDFIVINNGNASLTNASNGVKCTANIVKRITGDAVTKFDGTSPTITKVEQVDNTRTIRITFNEPVQAGNKVFEQAAYYGHQWTPSWNSQTKQTEKMADMSVRLVNDTTGKVYNAVNVIGYADLEDYMIDVEAQENLEAGTYTAYVTGVSDDYGNTCATEKGTFVVGGTTSEFRILSIFADKKYDAENGSQNNAQITLDNTDDTNWSTAVRDALYVEFSTQYASAPIANSVLNSSNWTLNGASLPVGTNIVAGVKLGNGNNFAFTGGRSGVTIILPNNTITDIHTTSVKVSSNVVSADNTNLVGQLTFNTPSILDKEAMPGVITYHQLSELKGAITNPQG